MVSSDQCIEVQDLLLLKFSKQFSSMIHMENELCECLPWMKIAFWGFFGGLELAEFLVWPVRWNSHFLDALI